MNNNCKTSPNQKTIQVKKEKCDKQNYYAAINLNALQLAAADLKSGAFKLWIYFAKNQPNFELALSNKAVADSFGIKKDQYDKAVKELITKGYLIETSKNHFDFYEIAKKESELLCGEKPLLKVVETNTEKQENPITNTTKNTNNTTKEKYFVF